MTTGVVLVAFGERAELVAGQAVAQLGDVCPDLPVYVHRERIAQQWTDAQQARYAKVSLWDWSPFDNVLYMDADTLAYQDVRAGFAILEDGWELAIAPSNSQGRDWLWHVEEAERAATERQLQAQALQLQAGVWFARRCAATERLWTRWREEWHIHEGQDQAALLRALYAVPVRVWMLGRPWNGGAIVGHRFGMIARETLR